MLERDWMLDSSSESVVEEGCHNKEMLVSGDYGY